MIITPSIPAQATQSASPTPSCPGCRERGPRAVISLDGSAPRTPAAARSFVQRAALAWRLPRPQVDDLVLIVSELVANAVRHTDSRAVTVAAAYVPGDALVSVTDGGPYRPLVAAGADDEAEGHRGLSIVEALASAWGHRRVGPGTRVWARIEVPLGATANRGTTAGLTA